MSSVNHEVFISEMLRYASAADTPDNIMDQLMEYLCENLMSDRAYVFEENDEKNFDNTYEYCRMGVNSHKDELQGLPYEGSMQAFYEISKRKGCVIIKNLEGLLPDYEIAYQRLKNRGIETLVIAPIEINNRYIGLFGVDNPPVEIVEGISEVIEGMEFIIDMILRMRDYSRMIEDNANRDALTGYKNRKALEWAYENRFGKATSLCVIMCDLNGLKAKNDIEGHKAGDKYICDAMYLLGEFFGKANAYRLGGDEFVVVVLSETRESIDDKVARMQQKGKETNVSMSLGIEYREQIDEDFEHIMHAADEKMYAAKERYYIETGINRRKV